MKNLLINFFNGSQTTAVTAHIAKLIDDKLAEHIEKYAAAFLKETNLKPSECVLICRQQPYMLGYEVEIKKKDTPQIKKQNEKERNNDATNVQR